MKYKCCHILKHGLCFFDKLLTSCCFSPNDQIVGGLPPIIFNNYKGELLSSDFLFERIHNYDDIYKKGKCIKSCFNCYHLEEKEWDEDDYIDYITITHFSSCQANCIYCTNNLEHSKRTNGNYKILPVLRDFKNKGIIRNGVELHIGGGEFTIYDECDELIEEFALSNYAKVYIPTNAIHFSEKLQEALCVGGVKSIIVSLDSGCRQTYKKIKRIDAFDKVIDNLSKYSNNGKSKGAICLKYIVIPSVNDNYSEFKKFLKIAKTVNANVIIIDVDAKYSRLLRYIVDDYLIHFVYKLKSLSEKAGFTTELYSFVKQCEEYKISHNKIQIIKSFIKYKFYNKAAKILYKRYR